MQVRKKTAKDSLLLLGFKRFKLVPEPLAAIEVTEATL